MFNQDFYGLLGAPLMFLHLPYISTTTLPQS